MSTYFGSAITIGISNDFMWIDQFVNTLYKTGAVYAYPLGKPVEWGGIIELPRKQSFIYFERYIKQLQTAKRSFDEPPSIGWEIDGIGYIVDVYSKPGYITLSLQLGSNKKYKDAHNKYDDFEYYLRLLMSAMKYFPILDIWAGCLDNFDDVEWSQKEGKWWGFKIQDPQPEYSFQMLDVIVSTTLTKDFLIKLINYATTHNYNFFPINIFASMPENPQHIIDALPLEEPFPENWVLICDTTEYKVRISNVPFARLLFRTEERKNAPHIEALANHALTLLSSEILEQIASFDSRYNYFISEF